MDGRWPIFFVPQIDDSFRLDFDPTGLDIGESFPVEYCNPTARHSSSLMANHCFPLTCWTCPRCGVEGRQIFELGVYKLDAFFIL